MAWKTWVFSKAERVIGRPKSPTPVKELAWQAVRFAVACGKSNPLSFALRPLAAHHRLRSAVGVYLALAAVIAAAVGPIPSLADNTGGTTSVNLTAAEPEVSLRTIEGVKVPLANYTISQRFWLFHSGIDMAAPIGEAIYPVMKGKVIKAENGWFGYGNMVMIDHGNGYQSLYGHMSKVEAKEGQEVNLDTEIGQVGSTGRSTGPHLHLEIYENGKTVNPAPIIGVK